MKLHNRGPSVPPAMVASVPPAPAAVGQTTTTTTTTIEATLPPLPSAATFRPPTRAAQIGQLAVLEALQSVTVTDEERAASAKLDAKVLKKYPVLAPLLTDPDAFMVTMRGRFEAQKQIPGADPYGFDFSEWGVPALQSMSRAIAEKIAELDPFLARLLPTRDNKVEQHIEVARLLDEMRGEIDGLLTKQTGGEPIPYRRVQELGFYVARTIGLLDLPKLNLRDRALLEVDRYLQGYEHAGLAEEARRYHANDFSVFQKTSPVGGFASAEETFTRAFFNPDKLELLALPTIDSLGAEPFTRLTPYNIFILGVTKDPAAADGFVRPGGDFYIHDMRHASAIFHKRSEYEGKHGLDDAQKQKLEKRIDLWKTQLDEARAAIPDKSLRWAVGFFMFNFHHDRGYPMVPSSYQAPEALNKVPKLLYAMLKVSGQPVGFDHPRQTLAAAHAWLQNFWLARLPEEQAIVGG